IIAITVMKRRENLEIQNFIAAGYTFLPAVLFFIGLAALTLGWAPRLRKVVYIYLVYSFMLTYFEGVLALPIWSLQTAIQRWIPQMPVDGYDAFSFFIITVVSLVLIVVGYLGYRRRDLLEEAS